MSHSEESNLRSSAGTTCQDTLRHAFENMPVIDGGKSQTGAAISFIYFDITRDDLLDRSDRFIDDPRYRELFLMRLVFTPWQGDSGWMKSLAWLKT